MPLAFSQMTMRVIRPFDYAAEERTDLAPFRQAVYPGDGPAPHTRSDESSLVYGSSSAWPPRRMKPRRTWLQCNRALNNGPVRRMYPGSGQTQ